MLQVKWKGITSRERRERRTFRCTVRRENKTRRAGKDLKIEREMESLAFLPHSSASTETAHFGAQSSENELGQLQQKHILSTFKIMKTGTEAWLGTKWNKCQGTGPRDSRRGSERAVIPWTGNSARLDQVHGSMAWKKWVEKNMNQLMITFCQARKGFWAAWEELDLGFEEL